MCDFPQIDTRLPVDGSALSDTISLSLDHTRYRLAADYTSIHWRKTWQ